MSALQSFLGVVTTPIRGTVIQCLLSILIDTLSTFPLLIW